MALTRSSVRKSISIQKDALPRTNQPENRSFFFKGKWSRPPKVTFWRDPEKIPTLDSELTLRHPPGNDEGLWLLMSRKELLDSVHLAMQADSFCAWPRHFAVCCKAPFKVKPLGKTRSSLGVPAKSTHPDVYIIGGSTSHPFSFFVCVEWLGFHISPTES